MESNIGQILPLINPPKNYRKVGRKWRAKPKLLFTYLVTLQVWHAYVDIPFCVSGCLVVELGGIRKIATSRNLLEMYPVKERVVSHISDTKPFQGYQVDKCDIVRYLLFIYLLGACPRLCRGVSARVIGRMRVACARAATCAAHQRDTTPSAA